MADGETLRYRVRWGLFSSAGEIIVSARHSETAGLPQINITTRTNTRGFVRNLYLFDGDSECVFDQRDGRLLAIKSWSSSSKKSTRTMAVFDHEDQQVQYVDYLRPERNTVMPLPEGNPMDLITCLIQTRTWDLKPGDKSPAVVMFDREFYDLTIVAEGYEKVRTPLGEYNTLVLVKFEVSMKVGTGVAMLSEYTPPTDSQLAANAGGNGGNEGSRP
jgi:hypothetical protein